MRIAEDVIIDACRLREHKIIIITRESWKAKKAKEEVWGAIRTYDIDKDQVEKVQTEPTGYIISFKNGSYIRFTSIDDCMGFQGMRADQIYCYKGDEFSKQEKMQMFIPLLATTQPRIPVKDRLREV